ncbi:MAG: hypothetical protein HGA19_12505 [Oscillochloris sp.]|nr:hypothetical protein [Oscillochloris sp.]
MSRQSDHNPVIEAARGRRLSEQMGWFDPDELAHQYIADMRACSGGMARYTLAERHEIDGYPPKLDGFIYNNARYLAAWQRRSGFHQPDAADYRRILTELQLVEKIEARVIDEIWLFAFPYAGYYESQMAGDGAVWCNAPALTGLQEARRRFVVMGFNFEREVGCMLENFGHRVESIMAHVYRGRHGEANFWERFTRYEQSAPGRAECGNVHFAPSSQHDYDWGNQREVRSGADAWYAFPNLSAPPRPMRCAEWGGGDMRLHHLWWLDHLPRVAGSSDGILNNWWAYALRPDLYL